MAGVTGIGGIFFRSKESQALAEWYEKHLGINSMKSMTIWQQEEGPTVFAPFKKDTDYFGSDKQQFMINFRVKGLDEFLVKLKEDGVTVDENQMEHSIGKFAWIYDPEGNKIELWEPADEKKELKDNQSEA
ncbi:MAG: VOC family protein [Flavobacterium sp.]|nr:MAG: VOC family protein [Flavobacterium sp.]